MAATSLKYSLHLSDHRLHRNLRQCRHFPSPSISSSSSTSSITLTLSTATATATSTSSPILTFDALDGYLASADFRQADQVTRQLLIALAGDAAQKRGYIFFSEVRFIAADDLRAIDELWRRHSGGRFGYTVQRRVWEKARRDFTRFFIKVGWMQRTGAEVEQFNYRSFPGEFIWELREDTPEGHLPLTNALRGTQLLASILMHPAFESEEAAVAAPEEEVAVEEEKGGKGTTNVLSSRRLETDYSF